MEREAKLAIVGERPALVADAIAALHDLAGHALGPAALIAIADIYFDTRDGAVGRSGGSLRLRVVGGRPLVTLKGAGRQVEPSVVEREELEMPWSETAYARLLDAVAGRGIRLRRAAVGSADAEGVLIASGLARIQARDTRRRKRNALAAGAPIAELAIDEVTYRLAAAAIRHHEVEIEATAPAGEAYLPRAVEALLARFGAALLPWTAGKLATGFAIERLLAAPDAARLVVAGRLAPAAYPRLAALLSAAPAPPGDG